MLTCDCISACKGLDFYYSYLSVTSEVASSRLGSLRGFSSKAPQFYEQIFRLLARVVTDVRIRRPPVIPRSIFD